jgi:type IV pilus assembly protein PilM
MPSDDLYVDWQIIGDDKNKVVVFLTAAPRSIVNSYTQLFKILAVEPMALEMSLASIARAMVSNKNQVEPVILLDIGDQASNMAIFDSNLRITGSHPIGGATMKQRLIEELKLSMREAAAEVRLGISKETKSSKIIKGEVDKLTTEMEKMIDYYKEKKPDAIIKKVLLCGGLGFLPGLPEYLKDQGFEAKVGNPWINISIYPLKPVPKEEASGYAPAIGLCLRGLADD